MAGSICNPGCSMKGEGVDLIAAGSHPASVAEWMQLPLLWMGSLMMRAALFWDLVTDVFYPTTPPSPL